MGIWLKILLYFFEEIDELMNDLLAVIKRACLAALIIILLLSLALGVFFELADKFSRVSFIAPSFLKEYKNLTSSLPPEQLAQVNQLLNQDYHYLARGAQNFVFLSDDGDYVLKLIRRKRNKLVKLQEIGLQIPFVKKYYEMVAAKKVKKKENFLTSCLLTDQELREQTGLVYLHFNATEQLHPTINLYNRIGKRYLIELDNTSFLLQKRGKTITEHINVLMKNNDQEGFQNALQQLVKLLGSCSQKLIIDRDINFNNNVGFIGDQAVFIDMGEFYRNQNLLDRAYCLDCLILQTFPFRKWLWENYPDLE
jgi:hypothetical protein